MDSLLAVRAQASSYRLVGPLSLVEEVMSEGDEGPERAHEGVHKVLLRLVPSELAPCETRRTDSALYLPHLGQVRKPQEAPTSSNNTYSNVKTMRYSCN